MFYSSLRMVKKTLKSNTPRWTLKVFFLPHNSLSISSFHSLEHTNFPIEIKYSSYKIILIIVHAVALKWKVKIKRGQGGREKIRENLLIKRDDRRVHNDDEIWKITKDEEITMGGIHLPKLQLLLLR